MPPESSLPTEASFSAIGKSFFGLGTWDDASSASGRDMVLMASHARAKDTR